MQFCYPRCCRSVRGEPPAPAAVRTRVTVSLPVTAVLLSVGVTATAVWQAEHALHTEFLLYLVASGKMLEKAVVTKELQKT